MRENCTPHATLGGMKYLMSEKNLGKLKVIESALEGRYTVKEAALKLGLSPRRVKQLKKSYREQGVSVVIHGNSGRHPINYTDEKLREEIVKLKKSERYKDTNFTHFTELLEEYEHIKISYSTVCGILKKAGIVSKKQHRNAGKKHTRRKRKSAFGDMLQGDATPFDWFGTGVKCTLHGFIDDATGKLTGLYFCQNECLMGYFEILRQTLIKHGLPGSLYLDKAGIFKVNTKKIENWTIDEILAGKVLDKTQFASIVEGELHIPIIYANSPQAKGRVERLWQTIQDRFVTMLKIFGITDMETANQKIDLLINYFNDRFAVDPESEESTFEKLDPSFDLDKILVVRHQRTTDNCGCFSFHNFLFQIDTERSLVKKKIDFIFSEKIGFMAKLGREYFPVTFLGMKNKRTITHIPDVTKMLLEKYYYADTKEHVA
jgi:transposase